MIIRPGVEFKPIESYALLADGYLRQKRPNLVVEAVDVHPEVVRRVS
jgi:hypothetical protein